MSTWPGWHEPIVLGSLEWAGVVLAHCIVLGIAWFRYRAPWRRGTANAS